MPGKPPTVANLTWIGDLKFAAAFPKHVHEATRGEGDPAERVAGAGAPGVILDSTRVAGPPPAGALPAGPAGPPAAPPTPTLPQKRHPPPPLRNHTPPPRPAHPPPPPPPPPPP